MNPARKEYSDADHQFESETNQQAVVGKIEKDAGKKTITFLEDR